MSSLRIENKQGFIPKFTQGLRRDLKELVSKDKSLENEALQVLFRLTGKDPEIAGFDISNLKDKTPMTIGEYTDQYNSKLPSEVYNCIRRIYFFMKIAPFEFTIDKKQLEMIPIAKSNCLVGFGFLNGIPVAVKEIPRDSFNPEEIAISLYCELVFTLLDHIHIQRLSHVLELDSFHINHMEINGEIGMFSLRKWIVT